MLKKQQEQISLLALKKIYKKSASEPIASELVHEIVTWLQAMR